MEFGTVITPEEAAMEGFIVREIGKNDARWIPQEEFANRAIDISMTEARLSYEMEKLDDRLEKLDLFKASSEFSTLDQGVRNALIAQREAMTKFRQALSTRRDTFK